MMKKLLVAAAVLAAAIIPARADYYVKDGNGVLKLFKAGTLAGSVVLPYNSLTDSNGLPFGTASNPVAMRFGTGVFLPDFTNPQHFICDSGCGGGGGGGLSVPYAGPIGANGTPIGFKDATGNLQPMLGDVTNGQWVSVKASVPIAVTGTFWQATQPVSGSVSLTGTLPAFAATPTFNLGTLGGAATAALQSAVQGTVAGGTAATASQLAGGVYNSTPITLSNGQGAAHQLDANGYLRVNVMTGGGGSSAFGAAFPASGVALGMSQGGNLVGVTGTSGNLNVQCANCSGSGVSTVDKATFTASTSLFAGSGGFFQTTATANPLTTGQQGMFQVTAQRALFSNLRDSSGTELGVAAAPLQVSLANTAANGTALLVTGTGGTFPVSQASAGNLNATVVGTGTFAVQAAISSPTAWGVNTLGSTTSGQSGQLALGAVTTAAPTYTTTQTNALSLTTAGALRVDGSGVTQPVSLTSTTITGTVAANVSQINGVTPLMGNGPTGTGSQRVTIASDNTAFSVNAIQSGTWNIGSITTLPALVTGSAIIGRVGIDQTTPGTTNLVSIGTNGTVNPTTAANWGINTLGSTTSGQSGQLGLGAVTTAAPTYTTAQSNALSLTTAGDLRTVFSNTSIAVTQATAGNLNATVVGTGTFAVQAAATLAAETTKVIGTVRTLGNAGAIVDFAGQNAASPANSWLIGGQFNTSPTTVTSGNSSPLQIDNAGNLKVNIVAGASSGAVAQGSTTSGQTGGLMQAAVTTAAPTYTTAQTNPLSLTTTGNLRVSDSTAQATLASILTAAQGANPVNVNAAVTAQTGLTPGVAQTGTVIAANTDLSSVKGTAIDVNSGNKSAGTPRVVIATDQPAIPAAGQVATGAAPPAGAQYVGYLGSGATGGLVRAPITCDQHAFFDGTTQLSTIVAGTSGRKTYICGFLISTGATATNIGLTSGTGTNCATTSVAITPVFKLVANDKVGANSAFWNGLITLTAADNLCQSASAANDHQVEVWYAVL